MFLRFKRKSSQLFVVFNCAAAADLKSAIPPSLWRNSQPCADLVCLHLCHPATCGPDVLEAKKKKKPCWVSENNFRADNCTELCKVEPAGQKGGRVVRCHSRFSFKRDGLAFSIWCFVVKHNALPRYQVCKNATIKGLMNIISGEFERGVCTVSAVCSVGHNAHIRTLK